MESAKKFGLFVLGMSSAIVSVGVVAGADISKAQAAHVNLVKNGGFELDPLVDPDYDPTRTNPHITDWNNDSQFFGYYNNNLENYANTGNQSLHIGYTPDDSFAYLSQTLHTQNNKEYQLSFYLASVEEAPRLGNAFQVFVDGNKIFDLANVSFQPFTQYDVNFVATTKSTVLKFATQVKYDWLNLDDVSVYRVKNQDSQSDRSVPEPTTIGGVAFAGLLGVWLKRKQLAVSIKSNKS